MSGKLLDANSKSDIPRMLLILENHYSKNFYSLWDQFCDGRRKVLHSILVPPSLTWNLHSCLSISLSIRSSTL